MAIYTVNEFLLRRLLLKNLQDLQSGGGGVGPQGEKGDKGDPGESGYNGIVDGGSAGSSFDRTFDGGSA